MIDELVKDLIKMYDKNTNSCCKKASWEDKLVIQWTLATIGEKVKKANFTKTAVIVVGDVLNPGDFKASKLYDPDFKHEYR